VWLRGLGLGRYEQAFRDNDVDARVLPCLTAKDLKEIGVASVGHRRLILQAIAETSAAPPPASPAASAEADVVPAAHGSSQAERRQLTVMFVDLVGSTELSRRLDPEDMREVIRAYQNATAGEILRFEGHVAKFMGDGILAYFGWPRAQEDAAERAVRAGLAAVQVLGHVATLAGEPLAARVGIATGVVVVGDLVGEGAAQEEAVVGETPNLAARLQQMAEPGAVVIAEATRRLVGGLFVVDALPGAMLRGFGDAVVRAFRVLGEGAAESRFEAMHGAAPGLMIGRDEELALLLERWRLTKAGEGQAVLLTGEPGIGKSRLVLALRERLRAEDHARICYACSPYHASSALWPVVQQLERAARFVPGDGPAERLAKLRTLLAKAVEPTRETVALLAELLGVPDDGLPPLALAPQQRKARTLHALTAQLEGLAARRPLLLILEDAHWLDPTTRELFDLAVGRIRRLRVLLLVTFRPELAPPWVGLPHVTLLTLNHLARAQSEALVARVAGGRPLPAEVVDAILARTEGVPLFVEELTKTVLESGLLKDAGGRYELTDTPQPLVIPASLQDSLMERLDRLGPVKEVAQIGAALGREFSHEVLAAVVPLGEDALRRAIDRLVRVELVSVRGEPPETTYSFKHRLVRDAAYGGMLKGRRRQVHARIATALEERFPDHAEARPELLAHHCTGAGLAGKAIGYWYKAGRKAMARSAMAEAVVQLTQALELLADLPAGPDRDRSELELQVALGGALVAGKGLAAPEVGKAFARARELGAGEGQPPQLLAALSGLFGYHQHASGPRQALEIAAELLRSAERQGDVAGRAMGHRCSAAASLFGGRPGAALAHFEQALVLYETADRTSPVFLWASDTRVASLSFVALALLWQGYPDQALARSRAALAEAQELGHAHTTSHALYLNCWLHQVRGEARTVQERADTLTAMAAEHGFPLWAASATILHGWAMAADGAVAEGVARMRQGLAAHQPVGRQLQRPYFLGLLAEVLTRAEEPSEASDLLDEALALVDRSGERCQEAELHRLKGELLLTPPARAAAATSFQRAVAVAREQGARLWELRAATSLARLWRDQGRRDEAHDLLAPVYDRFAEGFDMSDLRDAKALLDELPVSDVAMRSTA
jgi:predicted ATPase/class 3 adenylate cyclase